MNYTEMGIKDLEKLEHELINLRKFSCKRMKSLFSEQLELAKKITEEKEVNDRIVEQLEKIRTTIEVKEKLEFNKEEDDDFFTEEDN